MTAASSCRRKRWGCKKAHLTLHLGQKNQLWSEVGHLAFVWRLEMSIQKGPLSQAPFCSLSLLRIAVYLSLRTGATEPLFLLAYIKATPVKRHVTRKKRSHGLVGCLLCTLLSTMHKDEACCPLAFRPQALKRQAVWLWATAANTHVLCGKYAFPPLLNFLLSTVWGNSGNLKAGYHSHSILPTVSIRRKSHDKSYNFNHRIKWLILYLHCCKITTI